MDGTTAGNGTGPRLMQPVVKNVLLASADQVAIDAVAAKLMGFDPLQIHYIRLAHEQGLGTGDVREIEVVGDDLPAEGWGFKVGYGTHSFLAWLAWYGPTRVFQKAVLRTPLVVVPTLIGEFEQDELYWPLKYKAVARTMDGGDHLGAVVPALPARRLPGGEGRRMKSATAQASPEDTRQAKKINLAKNAALALGLNLAGLACFSWRRRCWGSICAGCGRAC